MSGADVDGGEIVDEDGGDAEDNAPGDDEELEDVLTLAGKGAAGGDGALKDRVSGADIIGKK